VVLRCWGLQQAQTLSFGHNRWMMQRGTVDTLEMSEIERTTVTGPGVLGRCVSWLSVELARTPCTASRCLSLLGTKAIDTNWDTYFILLST
jgi:hypothetical protein